jgi:bifunctional hydroxylase/dehydrase
MTADFAGLPLRLRPVGEVGPAGMAMVLPLGPEAVRIAVYERDTPVRRRTEPPAFEEVAAAFQRVTGEDVRSGRPLWTSYFTDSSRQASRYRRGRVFLAGDAAHVHLPIGAQGISAGLGDAVNLGWKLAAVVKGHAGDGLLDTYHTERHPVAARIIANTLTQRSLYLGGADVQPMRDVFAELLTHEEVRRHLIGMCTGLDIRYEVGDDHPLAGRRLPDQDLLVGDEKTHTYALLHEARGVLLNLHDSADMRATVGPWADRVTAVTATRPDPDAPAASVLVRPDGYVAWISPTGSADGLADALARWFGAPSHAGPDTTNPEGVRS